MTVLSKPCRKACPPAKSFLDLPGELRNKIYECAFSDSSSSFAVHLPLLHSNKQIRAEVLPLVFDRTTIEADISNFSTFAFVFFGPKIEKLEKKGFKEPERCTLIVHKKIGRDTKVSLPWLASFLKQSPGFGVEFDLSGWEKSASDLNLLVRALREKAAWTSLPGADLTFKAGYRWEITIRVKKVGDGPSWSHDRTRNRQADRLLVSLGLYKHISELPPINEGKRSLEAMLRNDLEGSQFGSAVPRLKIKVFQEDGVNVHTFPINHQRSRRG